MKDSDKELERRNNGAIQAKQDRSVRYQCWLGLPLALHGISCQIDNGSRAGIVGRTGGGAVDDDSNFCFVIWMPKLIASRGCGVDIAGVVLQ